MRFEDLVPMFMPSAPMAMAAASCLPSAQPPDATKGTLSSLAAWSSWRQRIISPSYPFHFSTFAKRTQLPISASPGCPAQSKPSILIMSTPTW